MLGSQRKFAEYIGKSKSMVAKLAKDGKLVLIDGQIDFEASKKKIELLQNVSNRGGNQTKTIFPKSQISKQKDIKQDTITDNISVDDIISSSDNLSDSLDNIVKIKQVYDAGKAKAAHYEGETKKLEFKKRSGELVEVSKISNKIFELGKSLKNSLAYIPLRLTPKIVAITNSKKEKDIQHLIEQAIEDASNEFIRKVKELF